MTNAERLARLSSLVDEALATWKPMLAVSVSDLAWAIARLEAVEAARAEIADVARHYELAVSPYEMGFFSGCTRSATILDKHFGGRDDTA